MTPLPRRMNAGVTRRQVLAGASAVAWLGLSQRALADASCAAPADIGDGWARVTPAEAGFDAHALCDAMTPANPAEGELHGIVVERGGKLVAETYFTGTDKPVDAWFSRTVQFGPTAKHDLRSISKSVTSLLVGIAQAQGKIASNDTSVVTLFPQFADLATPERKRITLEHLLTMSAGFEWDESGSYVSFTNSETRLRLSSNPLRYVMERAVVAPPGTKFNYNGGLTALLGELVERGTQTPLDAFARNVLFGPLGITDFEWKTDRDGHAIAFAGLRLRPRDLAKIGRLMLNEGKWNGQQVVPAAWVRESLRSHVAVNQNLGYGYQWWTGGAQVNGRRVPYAAGFGNGGQRLFMVPTLDLTVVVTAGRYNQDDMWKAPLSVLRQVLAAIPVV